MVLTDEEKKEKRKVSNKKYREEHSEEIKERDKKYRDDNKEKLKEYQQKYLEDNKEKIKERDKEYRKTPKGKRSQRIINWKRSGMIEPAEGWETFAKMVENTKNCAECGIELTIDRHTTSTTRCVDHSHITGLFRNVVCNGCNSSLPRGT